VALGGVPRVILYDNLKSAVLWRRGRDINFNPRLIEMGAHYHFEARPVAPARGNEKGRVERQIRFLRDRFFAARRFRDVDDLNAQFAAWRDEWAHARPWPDDESRTVGAVLAEERPLLLPLPEHPFEHSRVEAVQSGKTRTSVSTRTTTASRTTACECRSPSSQATAKCASPMPAR